MKQGKSLTELAMALEDLKANSKDFVVPTEKLRMTDDNKLEFGTNGDRKELTPTAYAHGQLATYSDIPKQYYDRLKEEAPALLATNVNHGLARTAQVMRKNGKPESRMVRTYKNDIRAVLSSSYRRLDSYDLAQTILPVLLDGKFQIDSSEITERRMYIKALTPKIQSEVKPGDVVQFGLMISNSDVGSGSFRVEPLVYRLVCKNGMISNTAIKKFHLGKNLAGDDIQELLTEETQHMTDQAFFAQVKDIVLASMTPERFELEVNRLREAADQRIQNFDLPEVVELTMKEVGVTGERVKNNIIQYLANGADGAGLTKWGLVNGLTFAAQSDDVSYDDSIELERAGAKVLELAPNRWQRIAGKKAS